MEQLGFQFKTLRQGIQYTDGHEREDVVKYRKTYLNKMKFLESIHKPPPTCDDGIPSWDSGKEKAARKVVFIYHDETSSLQMMQHPKVGMTTWGVGSSDPREGEKDYD